jgi:hypothetical protein
MAKAPEVMFAIKGSIQTIYPIVEIGKFKKAPVILIDQFGNNVALEAQFEMADQMASFPPGTAVDVTFALASNQMKTDPTRWFTSAVIKSIQPQAGVVAPAPVAAAAPVAEAAPPAAAPAVAPPADIPF